MRVSGQGHTSWFVRELSVPLPVSAGRLHWTWRAPLAPRGASIIAAATDDAAVCVFVVFGARGGLKQRPRVLFHALADGEPMPDRSDSPFGARSAVRPELAHDWVAAHAERPRVAAERRGLAQRTLGAAAAAVAGARVGGGLRGPACASLVARARRCARIWSITDALALRAARHIGRSARNRSQR